MICYLLLLLKNNASVAKLNLQMHLLSFNGYANQVSSSVAISTQLPQGTLQVNSSRTFSVIPWRWSFPAA